ncbi:TipAS antibiotic-recognition domain-containing protein [Paenibacillus larvae]
MITSELNTSKKIVDETLNKTNRYTREDWATITKKQGAIYQKIAGRTSAGLLPYTWPSLLQSPSYQILQKARGIGDLYMADKRFSSNIDKHQPGLAAFMREAMHVYCDRHEGK